MIEVLISSLSVLATVIHYTFLLSYKIGQLIIEALCYLLQMMGIACSNLLTLLTVISEDFYLFLTDIIHHVDVITSGIFDVITSVAKLMFMVVEALKFGILNLYNIIIIIPSIIGAGSLKALTNITYLFSTVKRLLLLFGSGIWFTLTLFPLFIIYLLSLCGYFIASIFKEIVNVIQSGITQTYELACNVLDFVIDVPLEAIAGLAVGCCIFYILLKCHLILYRILERMLRLVSRHLNLRISDLRRHLQIRRHMHRVVSSELRVSDEPEPETSRNKTYDSRYCIICQEHYKCILMLPCKHVCLCSECNKKLRYIGNTCPLCRCEVKKTMKVFV